MAGRETKFCLQLCKGRKVVINVKIYDGGQAFVRLLYKSSILTNGSIGGRSRKIQHTLNLCQNLKCITHNEIILKTSKRYILFGE